MERYPNRFMLGSDFRMGKKRKSDDSEKWLDYLEDLRTLVSPLSKQAQRKIMFENANKVWDIRMSLN